MLVCALMYIVGSKIYKSEMLLWIHHNPEIAARNEAGKGKAYLGQDCRVLNTNFVLTHPGSHIEVGYLLGADKKKEPHLWAVCGRRIIDLAVPAELPRVTIGKYSPERGWYEVRAMPGSRDWVKLEWGRRYINAYLKAKGKALNKK